MKQQDTEFREINVNYIIMERSGINRGQPFQNFFPYTDVRYGSLRDNLSDWDMHGEDTIFDDEQIPEGFSPIVVGVGEERPPHGYRPVVCKTYEEAVEVCKNHKKTFEEKGSYSHKNRIFKPEL
jgi:hypothetical protein